MTDRADAAAEVGQLVREVWIAWAREQPDVAEHPSWLVPWDALPARDREVDEKIGATIVQRERDRMAGLLALAQEIRASDWIYDHMPSLHARAVAALADGEGRADGY